MVQQLYVVSMVSRCATAVLEIKKMETVVLTTNLLPFSVLNHKEKAEKDRGCSTGNVFFVDAHTIQDIAGKVCLSQDNKLLLSLH